MRIRQRRRESAAFLLLVMACVGPCFGAAAEGITGVFYKDDLNQPLPGALVALYRADDNLLVDFTYTLDSGRFTIKPPPAAGQFYVVATKDQLSRRVDFEFNPENPPINLTVQQQQKQSALAGWVKYAWTKGDSLVQVLIGLLLGLVFKWRDDRKKARKAFIRGAGIIKVGLERLLSRYERLIASIEAFAKSVDDLEQRRAEYVRAVGEVKEALQELQKDVGARSDLEDIIYDVRREVGVNSYLKFKRSLQGIEKFANSNPDAVLTSPPAARAELLNPFAELRESYRELIG